MREILRIVITILSILLSVTAVAETKIRLEPISPIPDSAEIDETKLILGKRLFNDPNLSRDGTVSCASCHNLNNAGVDGRALSSGVDGQLGNRNAPTVFNSGLSFRQFWDGRVSTLEEQAMEVLRSPIEMDNDWDSILNYLRSNNDYQAAFEQVYGGSITQDNVLNAIADFERSLLTPNGAFDRYLKGDDDAIDQQTKRGYQLFKSYGCVSCHQGVAVGGNMYEKLGVVIPYYHEETAVDEGRYIQSGDDEDLLEFKVPGLRNVAQTAPYFHDGSISSLEEAVSLMAKHQLGRNLSKEEIADIVKFLQSLDGPLNEQ